jgi:hypothetical protein
MNFRQLVTITALVFVSTGVFANTIRATQLSSLNLNDMPADKFKDLLIEFRAGDEIPLNFAATGDLFLTTQASPVFVKIQKDFWLKFDGNELMISFDQQNYKKMKDALNGRITAGASTDHEGGGVAQGINVLFTANLKK